VSFSVTAAGSFSQSVTIACTTTVVDANCTLTPGSSVNPTSSTPVAMTASVTVPVDTVPGNYPVTIQASSAGTTVAITAQFMLNVTTNPDFVLAQTTAFPEVNAGSTGTSEPILISSQDGFTGTVNLSCPPTFGTNSCSIAPSSVNSFPVTATLTINGTSFVAGNYSLVVGGTSGSVTHNVSVNFNVGDYSISGTQSLTVPPSGQGVANLTVTSEDFYVGTINVTCDPSALAGATCALSPANPINVASDAIANLTATVNVPNSAVSGSYNIHINAMDALGPSHSYSFTLTVGQDFVVTSSTTSQTVNAGQTTGPYNLTVLPVGSLFNAAVTLACSGLPALAQCAFAPAAPVTPGSSPVTVVMTISTTAATSASRLPGSFGTIFYATFLLLPGIVLAGRTERRSRKRKRRIWTLIATLFATLLLLGVLTSCSGVSSGGGGGQSGTPSGTYTINVTGSSPGTPADAGQSTQVTLVVN
jgi:hypothetical protein